MILWIVFVFRCIAATIFGILLALLCLLSWVFAVLSFNNAFIAFDSSMTLVLENIKKPYSKE